MARLSKRTPEVRARFLAALSDGLSVTAAAIAAGARRSAMYGWRAEDPLFAEAWDEAIEEGTDKLEDEARRRALNGSDQLIMFMLKARRPAKYRERSLHEHTGPARGTGPGRGFCAGGVRRPESPRSSPGPKSLAFARPVFSSLPAQVC